MSSRADRKRRELEAQGLMALLIFGCNCGGPSLWNGGRRALRPGEALAWAQLHTAHAIAQLPGNKMADPETGDPVLLVAGDDAPDSEAEPS